MNLKNPRFAYREAAVQSANSIELVVMLYDMLVEDIRGAIDALRENDVEKRSEQLKHGMLVLQQLQGSLDFENGGQTATTLDRFYTIVRAKLMEAHIKSSLDLLGEQIRLLLDVRDAWSEARREQSNVPERAVMPPPVETDMAVVHGWSA